MAQNTCSVTQKYMHKIHNRINNRLLQVMSLLVAAGGPVPSDHIQWHRQSLHADRLFSLITDQGLCINRPNSRVVKGVALIAEGRGFDSVCLVPIKKIMNSVISQHSPTRRTKKTHKKDANKTHTCNVRSGRYSPHTFTVIFVFYLFCKVQVRDMFQIGVFVQALFIDKL